MHPINFLFDDIYRKHWGIPAPHREFVPQGEAPVRPKFHPLQKLPRLP